MSIDSVVSSACGACVCVVVAMAHQFRYVILTKSYAQHLQKEVGKLAYKAEMVRNKMEVARNNSRNVYPYVTQWQANAEEALKEAQHLLEDFEKASKTCCLGLLPDPTSRYNFSRQARAKLVEIRRLAEEYSQLEDISFSDPTPEHAGALTTASREYKVVVHLVTATASASSASTSNKLKDDDIFESRELIMQVIPAALADNSNSQE